jgi:hypothetical protein
MGAHKQKNENPKHKQASLHKIRTKPIIDYPKKNKKQKHPKILPIFEIKQKNHVCRSVLISPNSSYFCGWASPMVVRRWSSMPEVGGGGQK